MSSATGDFAVFTTDGTAAHSREDHEATLRNIDRYFGKPASVARVEAVWTANER